MAFWAMLALSAGLTTSQAQAPVQSQAPASTAAPSQVEDVEVVARMRAAQVRERVDAFIETNMGACAGPPVGALEQAGLCRNRLSVTAICSGGD